MPSENSFYIIVIYVVITVNYCKCMLLLYSPLNSYLYVHGILDFKSILLLLLVCVFRRVDVVCLCLLCTQLLFCVGCFVISVVC